MAKILYNAKVYEDTSANFASDETIYSKNDLLFVSDTGEFKRGDGENKFADLPVIGGGGEGDAVTWDTLSGKPEVIAAGSDASEARTAIGAGTSSLAIGTTASTAAAGNHNHAVTADAASGLAAAANIQALAVALSARIKALEDA